MALRAVKTEPDDGAKITFNGSLSGYVRDLLKAGETVDVGEIADELGLEKDRVRHAVGNVRQGGLPIDRVGKVGDGRYRLGGKRAGRAGTGGGKTAARLREAVRPGDINEAAGAIPDTDDTDDADDTDLSPRARRKVKATEAPMLGAKLKVVALALERGDVVVRLEGDGDVWTAVLRK